MNPNKVEWIEQHGSIRARDTIVMKSPSGDHKVPIWIAFNVGRETAEHIVRLHNESIDPKRLSKIWDRFIAHLNIVQPLGKNSEVVPHLSFIGAIDKYKRIFTSSDKHGTQSDT